MNTYSVTAGSLLSVLLGMTPPALAAYSLEETQS